MPTQAKAPTTELGHVATWSQLAGYPDDASEYAGPLTWPNSIRTFDLMRVNSTVHQVLSAVTHPVRRPGVFALDPQGARPDIVRQLSEDLDLPILGQDRTPPPRRRGRFSWLEHLRLALLMLVYGHMGFELLCDPDALAATGDARLWKLAPRFPQSIEKITTAPDGGLESITQYQIGKEPPRPIPVGSLVWYANEREGAAWQGRSILRPCYGDWLLLDRLLRVRGMLMERQGMGVPVGEAPAGANQDVIDLMASLAQQARAGDQSGVGIPNGGRIRLLGVEGTLPDINAAIADHKAALVDSVLASWLRLGTGKSSGNRALGQTFVDQFTQSEDMVAGQIANVATQHVVEDLVDLNWGPDEPAPAVVARPIDAETDIDPESLVALIEAGAVTPDDSLEEFIRARFRLPKRTGPRPAPPVPMPSPTQARRRNANLDTRNASVRAKAVTWTERVADALAATVDASAIAAARADGKSPTDAVAAGLSTDDTSGLAALLVEMWGASYNAGATKAAEKAPVAAARRTSVVMASLSDMVAKAGDIAGGILSSLADRLATRLGADDLADLADPGVLAEQLATLAADADAAERIAVTETQRATVAGAVDTWESMGITETRWVRTSGSDIGDECEDLDGTTSADGWDDLPPLHPNCSCEIEPA